MKIDWVELRELIRELAQDSQISFSSGKFASPFPSTASCVASNSQGPTWAPESMK